MNENLVALKFSLDHTMCVVIVCPTVFFKSTNTIKKLQGHFGDEYSDFLMVLVFKQKHQHHVTARTPYSYE